VPGGARPWNQHAELGPVATSKAPRGQEGFFVKSFTGDLCRRMRDGDERWGWLDPRTCFPMDSGSESGSSQGENDHV
jgi:hypothetical protein